MKLHLPKNENGGNGPVAALKAAVNRQSAIALVITLIMLSVTAFITITFLIMSQRERGAVTVAANETDARLAADTAVQQATSRLLAKTIALNDPNAYDLFVSTNYINPVGFSGTGVANQFTNVSYVEAGTGLPLNNADMLQNLGNLLYDPRPPVFVTNPITGSNEFRFFLNLARKYDQNGNSIFATNGYLPTISTNPSLPFIGTDGALTASPVNIMSNFYVGDPEWIGVLERPDQPHSSSNRFIARYAYIVLPAGKTLDLNYIHNYSKSLGGTGSMTNSPQDFFWRDQGIGTWEDNLAAFLADLNTNYWNPSSAPYDYLTNGSFPNTGFAFDDALSILSYRYNSNYDNLFTLPPMATNAEPFADFYANGPLMTGTAAAVNNSDSGLGFPGANNPTHYFTMQDLFDPAKTSGGATGGFTNRLISAGQDLGSYNRYTFYRMLAQIGTDTAPEHGKININYTNVDLNGNIVPDMETNYGSWNGLQFFTNVAPRLLTNYFGVPAMCNDGTNLVAYNLQNNSLQFNIEIYPTNYYTPSVHRLLQLAANIYEATTNNADMQAIISAPGSTNANIYEPRLPHVYRPIFGKFVVTGVGGYTNICITNYVEETNVVYETPGYTPPVGPSVQIRDVNDLNPNTNADPFSILGTQPNDIVYGVPLVVGARKGLPNFNQMAMQNAITVTRKLQFFRGTWPAKPITATNVMYNLSISNAAAIQAWNSYSNAYPRSLTVTGAVDVAMTLMTTNFTTGVGFQVYSNHFFAQGYTNLNPSTWIGYSGANSALAASPSPFSFQLPLNTNNMYCNTNGGYMGTILTNFTYQQDPFPTNILLSTAFPSNLTEGEFPIPRWWYHQNTRVRCMMVDTSVTPNRIVDYVSLSGVENPVDVTFQLMGAQVFPRFLEGDASANAEWATNRDKNLNQNVNTVPVGIFNQIDINLAAIPPSSADWVADMQAAPNDVNNGTTFFQDNYNYSPSVNASIPPPDLTNMFYAPYDPTRTVLQNITWQANDPLVHYMVGDLINTNNVYDPAYLLNKVLQVSPGPLPPLPTATNSLNARYQPWGGHPGNTSTVTPDTDSNIAVKDPLITQSDAWQFPTNKLPGVGWIGRVHRGTPWQTVYLKPAFLNTAAGDTNLLATWTNWAGDSILTNLYTTPWNTNAITNAWSNGWNVVISSNAITQTNVDAALTLPTNDWSLFDILTAIPNDNASRGQLSVNQTNLAAWSAVMSGVVVISNDVTGNLVPVVIQPSAVTNTLQGIVDAINAERLTNYNGSFKHLGDVLSTPQLTISSPYLTSTNVSDATLERIPQQVLGLLRGPETRFVVYAYGQSLGPAPRSLTSSGLCQNYQITGETAVRAVIRVDGTTESPHVVVESFNYLSPNE